MSGKEGGCVSEFVGEGKVLLCGIGRDLRVLHAVGDGSLSSVEEFNLVVPLCLGVVISGTGLGGEVIQNLLVCDELLGVSAPNDASESDPTGV